MPARSASAERINWCVRRLTECRSTTAVVAELSEREGISRRQAQRIVGQAHLVLIDDLEEAGVERKAVVAQLHHALTEAMAKALRSDQPAVVVGCARAIADLLQLTPPRRP